MRLLGQFQTCLFFFTRTFFTHKKCKNTKNTKSIKSTKTQTSEQVTFLPLDVFYVHKNDDFFVFVCWFAFFSLVCFLLACLLFVHLFAQNLFAEKIKKFEIALMASFTLLLNQELFLLALKSAIFVSPKQIKNFF